MIRTTIDLIESMNYRQPQAKIRRMVADKKIIPIRRGLYETNPDTAGYLLANIICGPSYISFEYALSWHGLIPERAEIYTSASFRKNKTKVFDTAFGRYSYHDIPAEVYPYGVSLREEAGYSWLLASPEKALCDLLYIRHPVRSIKVMREILFEDMRIEPEAFWGMDMDAILFLGPKYHASNLDVLSRLVKKGRQE